MSFFGNIFGKKRNSELDLEKTVGEYLLKLLRCSKNVVIVSPKYGETHYTCEIIVDAKDLLPWAEHHAESTWSSDQDEQAAKNALPLWLRGADYNDSSISYVPHYMYKVLRPYVLNFVNDGITRIYCLECSSFVNDVSMEKLDRHLEGSSTCWIDVWKCPKGHQLYHEEKDIHFFTRR